MTAQPSGSIEDLKRDLEAKRRYAAWLEEQPGAALADRQAARQRVAEAQARLDAARGFRTAA
jgi:hypothetical protein